MIRLLFPPIMILGCVGAILSLLLVMLGFSPMQTAGELWQGSLGSPQSIGMTLNKTCPLLLSGLAVALSFRCKIWNIGAEGQFLMGALGAAALNAVCPIPYSAIYIPLLLLMGFIAGGIWGALAGILKAKRGVQEIISTIMLNFIALYLMNYCVQTTGPLHEIAGTYPQTDPITPAGLLPKFYPLRFHIGIFIALTAAVAVAVIFAYTVYGFRIRVLGFNPVAGKAAGIPVKPYLISVIALSGALAGLAGAIELCGVSRRLYENYSPGYGYSAIAVALLGRLHPLWIILAALFFGALEAGSGNLQRTLGIPSVLTWVVQSLIILGVLVADQWRFAPRIFPVNARESTGT